MRFATAGILAVAGWAAAAATATTSYVPVVTGLRATPKKFCVRGSRCSSPGTELHFTLSAPARVTIEAIPRFTNGNGALVKKPRRFGAGANTMHYEDKRLRRGKWKLTAQPMNSHGTGIPSTFKVRIVKHG